MTTYTLNLTPPDAPATKVSGLSRSEAMTALTNLMYPMPGLVGDALADVAQLRGRRGDLDEKLAA